MAEFTYEARAKTGTASNGTLTAGSEREAMAILDARGLFPIRIAPIQAACAPAGGASGSRAGTSPRCSRNSPTCCIPACRCCAAWKSSNGSRPCRPSARCSAKCGPRSPTAPPWPTPWRKHPHVFNELTVSMVRAGQEGGFLEDVLKRVADFTEHQEDLKSKVVGSLAYPVFLAVVGTIVLLILVIVLRAEVRADLRQAPGERASCRA